MKKTFMFVTGIIMILLLCSYKASANSDTISIDGIYYELASLDSGERYAKVVGYDYDILDFCIPSVIEYEGNLYSVTELDIRYLEFENVESFKVPESINKATTVSIDILSSALKEIIIECPFSAFSDLNGLYIISNNMNLVIRVQSQYLDEYKDFFEQNGHIEIADVSDLYERNLTGISVGAIGDTEAHSKYIVYDGQYFEITSEKRKSVKLIGAYHLDNSRCYVDGSYEVPAVIYENGKAYTVTAIGTLSLVDVDGVVRLPEGVKKIEPASLGENVVGIIFPDTVKSLPEQLFADGENTPSLVYVKLPEELKTIPKGIFRQCHKLRGIVVPESVTKIGSYAFPDEMEDIYLLGTAPKYLKYCKLARTITSIHCRPEVVNEAKERLGNRVSKYKWSIVLSSLSKIDSIEAGDSVPVSVTDIQLTPVIIGKRWAEKKVIWYTNKWKQKVSVSEEGMYYGKNINVDYYGGIYCIDIFSGSMDFLKFVE